MPPGTLFSRLCPCSCHACGHFAAGGCWPSFALPSALCGADRGLLGMLQRGHGILARIALRYAARHDQQAPRPRRSAQNEKNLSVVLKRRQALHQGSSLLLKPPLLFVQRPRPGACRWGRTPARVEPSDPADDTEGRGLHQGLAVLAPRRGESDGAAPAPAEHWVRRSVRAG